jgi:hypothetical protein
MSIFKSQPTRCLGAFLTLLLNSGYANADPTTARTYRFDIAAEPLSQALRNYG